MALPLGNPPAALMLPVLATAAVWLLLYRVNEVWSDELAWSVGVTWLYLPAALRPLAVLLFGWRGALGLFAGALASMALYSESPPDRWVAIAALSAVPPLVAVTLVLRRLRLRADLHGLTAAHLALLAAACSALSVCVHNVYYWHSEIHETLLAGMLPMFVGDMLGTLVVLYAARSLLRLHARLSAARRG